MIFYYIKNFSEIELDDIASIIFSFCGENDDILFAYIESNLEFETSENKDFITRHELYKSNQWIFPQKVPNSLLNIIWYRTMNRDEIKRAIAIENLFRCIIVPLGLNIQEYNYLLYIIENEEGPVLVICDKINNFNEKIAPKIKPYLGNCIISNQI